VKKASLFSGIGGIDLAAHWAGMETVVFCEREPFPQRVLRKHWPHVPIIDDVRDFTRKELERRGIGTIDIISAGYPCQPFSYAGKRRGAEDDRHLWPEVKRILSEIRPRWFVGENVAGHITLGLDDVLSDLENEGYTAQPFVIPAAAVYASHRRDRVFIVACAARELPYRGRGKGRRRNGHSDGSQDVADPAGKRCGEARERIGRPQEWAAGRSEIVDDTTSTRREARFSGQSGEIRVEARRTKPERLCDALAHTNSERCKERHTPAISEGLGQRSRGNHAGRAYGARRTIEPGVGGGADELSRWLDGRGLNPLDALKDIIDAYPQPALMGQPQYDWEPPRVATGVKNRAARLKALGNAVDPLQIFPIMYGIRVIDDYFQQMTR
jgi:DNA (cytosine-5)-methyltransferase 1